MIMSGVKKYKAALNTDVKEYVTNIMMRKKENNKNNNWNSVQI